ERVGAPARPADGTVSPIERIFHLAGDASGMRVDHTRLAPPPRRQVLPKWWSVGPMSSPSQRDHDRVPLNPYRASSHGTARVVSNVRLTPPTHDDVRHIVLDLDGLDYRYLEGQSLGVLPPGTDAKGHPNKLRLYSIASTRLGDDGRGCSASLCVKRVIYHDPE